MSIVDLILILLALLFAFSGFRQGLIVSAASFLGFFGGAVLGAQLSGPVADRISGSSGTRGFAALGGVLAGAPLGQGLARAGGPGGPRPGPRGAAQKGGPRGRGGVSAGP